MDLALSTANYLRPIADALVYINTTKVHPVWFPYAIAPTLHAARISIVYQSNARRSPSALSWGTYITGYLIMVCILRPFVDCVWLELKLLQCWGGGLLSHLLLGLPPPMLYSFGPAINYITVHLFVTLFFKHFPDVCIASPIMISVTDLNILAAISTNPRHSSFPHGCPYSHKCRYIFFESSLRSKRPPRICIFTSHPYVGGGHRVSRGRFLGKHSWYLECRLGIEHPSSASRWRRLAWHSRFMGWCFGWLVFSLYLDIQT